VIRQPEWFFDYEHEHEHEQQGCFEPLMTADDR